jgi:hypothetical protein
MADMRRKRSLGLCSRTTVIGHHQPFTVDAKSSCSTPLSMPEPDLPSYARNRCVDDAHDRRVGLVNDGRRCDAAQAADGDGGAAQFVARSVAGASAPFSAAGSRSSLPAIPFLFAFEAVDRRRTGAYFPRRETELLKVSKVRWSDYGPLNRASVELAMATARSVLYIRWVNSKKHAKAHSACCSLCCLIDGELLQPFSPCRRRIGTG